MAVQVAKPHRRWGPSKSVSRKGGLCRERGTRRISSEGAGRCPLPAYAPFLGRSTESQCFQVNGCVGPKHGAILTLSAQKYTPRRSMGRNSPCRIRLQRGYLATTLTSQQEQPWLLCPRILRILCGILVGCNKVIAQLGCCHFIAYRPTWRPLRLSQCAS